MHHRKSLRVCYAQKWIKIEKGKANIYYGYSLHLAEEDLETHKSHMRTLCDIWPVWCLIEKGTSFLTEVDKQKWKRLKRAKKKNKVVYVLTQNTPK